MKIKELVEREFASKEEIKIRWDSFCKDWDLIGTKSIQVKHPEKIVWCQIMNPYSCIELRVDNKDYDFYIRIEK